MTYQEKNVWRNERLTLQQPPKLLRQHEEFRDGKEPRWTKDEGLELTYHVAFEKVFWQEKDQRVFRSERIHEGEWGLRESIQLLNAHHPS